ASVLAAPQLAHLPLYNLRDPQPLVLRDIMGAPLAASSARARAATRGEGTVMATAAPERAPSSTTTQKWVWLFREGNASMRDLLGGKGAGLAEMTNAGLPVPPGFTITTDACNEYYRNNRQFPASMWDQAMEALKDVERAA